MTKINVLKSLVSVLLLAALGFIASCGKEDEQPDPVAVEFATSAATLAENSGATFATVTVELAKAAAKSGTITIAYSEANASYATHFTTDPAGSAGEITLSVAKGATAAQFKIFAVNNTLLEDDRAVAFSISEVSDAFTIGTTDTYTITLIDDEGPVTANFVAATSSQAENNGIGTDVELQLSAAAPGSGSITITIATTAAYTTNYTTNPVAATNVVTVPVAAGNQNLAFKIAPVDDGNVNANRQFTFTITGASGVVNVGSAIVTHTHTITDNETPSTATFNAASSSIGENVSAGVTVPITLAPQTNGIGTVVIDLSGAVYGTDFTTDPAATNNKVVVNVASGVTTASLKIIPVDDGDDEDNRVVTLTMSSATGIVVLGANNITHTVTIEEDDAITTIADLRALYPGTTAISTPLRIQGIVTSSNPQVNTNNIWVQDATGGIVVRFSAANNNTIARADEVIIQLNGGTLTSFNGLLQVEGVANANASIVDNNNTLPTPEVVTVVEAATGNYEGKLIRVNSVAFVDADGTATMSGTKTVSNGTNTISVRTETGAPHAGSVMPLGFGTVTGLAGEFTGAVQIIPIVFADDVFASSAVGTIGVTQSLNNFGSVNKDAVSASQSYTIQGTTLTQDITITASTGYKVSTDDTNFSSSVTILAANANSLNTIYVRFAPTTGVNQAINGTIVQKSLGAAPVSFAVSGTEAGNASSNLLLLENFSYTGGGLTANATGIWIENTGGGTNNIPVVTNALTFTGYPSSEVGNSITLTTSGQDAYRAFTGSSVSSGDLYVSFLMNVTSAQATGDYFFALLPDNSVSNYTARTFIKSSGAGFALGLSKGSVGANETAVYGATEYSFNTTYLVVIKYSFVSGTINDVANIFVVNGAIPGTEPGTSPVGPTVSNNADQPNLGRVAIRQGSAANAPGLKLSGIRVAQTWTDLFN
jgi:hypothetical protein